MSTVIAKTVARAVVPIILLVSVAFFLQGHNLPGGGFIAGVLTAVGISLLYIVYSLDYLEDNLANHADRPTNDAFDHLPLDDYRLLTGIGLSIAAGTGLVAMMFGEPFLTHTDWLVEHVPVFQTFHFASAAAFDLGIYLVVVAGLLTIISVVGEE